MWNRRRIRREIRALGGRIVDIELSFSKSFGRFAPYYRVDWTDRNGTLHKEGCRMTVARILWNP